MNRIRNYFDNEEMSEYAPSLIVERPSDSCESSSQSVICLSVYLSYLRQIQLVYTIYIHEVQVNYKQNYGIYPLQYFMLLIDTIVESCVCVMHDEKLLLYLIII